MHFAKTKIFFTILSLILALATSSLAQDNPLKAFQGLEGNLDIA